MELAQLLSRFDSDLMAEFFSSGALAKAKAYVARIQQLEAAGHQIQGLVQGTDSAPYKTVVRIERREFLGEASIELLTRCSCPVGNRCKHAAALIMAARRPGALQEKPRAEILKWVQTLRQRVESANKTRKPSAAKEAVFYIFKQRMGGGELILTMAKGRVGPDGELAGTPTSWTNHEQALLKPPSFVREEDLHVFRLVRALERRQSVYHAVFLRDAEGYAALGAALSTGRAYYSPGEHAPVMPLHRGGERAGRIAWFATEQGMQARLVVEPAAGLYAHTEPLVYFDADAGEAGTIKTDCPAVVTDLLRLPPLSRTELPVVAAALAEVAPELPVPKGMRPEDLPELTDPCQPVLVLGTVECWNWRRHRGYESSYDGSYGYGIHHYDYAVPAIRYGEATFIPGSTNTLASLPDGRTVRVKRDPDAEAAAWKVFTGVGFQPVKGGWLSVVRQLPDDAYGLESEAEWTQFFAGTSARLKEAGWRLEFPTDFRHYMLLPTDWFADLEDGDNGWFNLSLGIEVEGRRVDLAPLLHAVFRQDNRWLDAHKLDKIPDGESVILETDEGERIALPAGRLKPIARTLIDLFDRPEAGLRVSQLDAPRLARLLDEDWNAGGLPALSVWLDKIRSVQQVAPVAPPDGLTIALRPYQLDGLAWLQHLRAHDLGGILADDMGLGKTVQTLAHLLVEKRAGRLDKPALVVLPTSLVFNWQQESARFTPDLRVLNLRGSGRFDAFERIPDHDICLTTYPLLWRDREYLAEHEYHTLILDEAQTVKNAASQAAQVVRTLSAKHRLCITGTPLENHLGELWSQFDFLLPGFLGDAKDFTARWRTPIEKRGDIVRRDLLAQRIGPFILRRRKEEVATELPPKTIVVRSVELEGRQRDLYETVRATMDKRVRDEIAARGFARSQIVILDALLKLRQVCCDPRLLKMEAATKVRERAKMDLLMDMVPELVAEGRRILIFSQFTTMLGLIQDELIQRRITFSLLTGDTKDRETPVRRFQEGDVPVFLISLKAGGVGLNLTAADTVIHFDPWWNPAAENQATDRAHRLGQDKPVFVYKLVVAGSIEERIVGLQEHKAALAASILNEDADAMTKFGETDIRALLAPLPEAEPESERASTAGGARRGRPRKAQA